VLIDLAFEDWRWTTVGLEDYVMPDLITPELRPIVPDLGLEESRFTEASLGLEESRATEPDLGLERSRDLEVNYLTCSYF
jgi:hypothetical protein